MAPLMLKIPGKRVNVHGEVRVNTLKYRTMNVPARMPPKLDDSDSKD